MEGSSYLGVEGGGGLGGGQRGFLLTSPWRTSLVTCHMASIHVPLNPWPSPPAVPLNPWLSPHAIVLNPWPSPPAIVLNPLLSPHAVVLNPWPSPHAIVLNPWLSTHTIVPNPAPFAPLLRVHRLLVQPLPRCEARLCPRLLACLLCYQVDRATVDLRLECDSLLMQLLEGRQAGRQADGHGTVADMQPCLPHGTDSSAHHCYKWVW